jgi:hypothetical protein
MFKEVSKDVFYNIIKKYELDVCVSSKWDGLSKLMETKFYFRNGVVFGYINEYREEDRYYPKFDRFSIDENFIKKYPL